MNNNDHDFLHGAEEIGAFLGESTRRTYYMLEKRQIPAAKVGRLWLARKSRLLEHLAQQEAEMLEAC